MAKIPKTNRIKRAALIVGTVLMMASCSAKKLPLTASTEADSNVAAIEETAVVETAVETAPETVAVTKAPRKAFTPRPKTVTAGKPKDVGSIVQDGDCKMSDMGVFSMPVVITNSYADERNFSADIWFTDQDGKKLAEGTVIAQNIQPGTTVRDEASGFPDVADDVTNAVSFACEIVSAESDNY